MRVTNEQKSATMATSNLKFGMSRDIITNSNITKAFIVNPCDSCNTDVDTPLNAIHVTVYRDLRNFILNVHEQNQYLVGPDKLSDPWTALFRAY